MDFSDHQRLSSLMRQLRKEAFTSVLMHQVLRGNVKQMSRIRKQAVHCDAALPFTNHICAAQLGKFNSSCQNQTPRAGDSRWTRSQGRGPNTSRLATNDFTTCAGSPGRSWPHKKGLTIPKTEPSSPCSSKERAGGM
ncbi:hypothetical protein AOLI_G00106770 [Acnodon oligacanthus]